MVSFLQPALDAMRIGFGCVMIVLRPSIFAFKHLVLNVVISHGLVIHVKGSGNSLLLFPSDRIRILFFKNFYVPINIIALAV